ncbi:hydrophobic surface binding protein A-domain-containing protein [Infundibulicybe gibba]|nr:hydrophobic surface binding protein A-domain-containing protein [Infundibulicybe gibba]
MRFSTIRDFASLALTGFAAPSATGTVTQVEADITKISAQVTTLDNAIKTFGTSKSLIAALAMHSNSVTLGSNIDTGTADLKATPPPIAEADAQAILTNFQALLPRIIAALDDIVAQKANIAALPIPGIPILVCRDLKNLQASTDAFADALIASAPADLKTAAITLKNAINAAFVAALAASGR